MEGFNNKKNIVSMVWKKFTEETLLAALNLKNVALKQKN